MGDEEHVEETQDVVNQPNEIDYAKELKELKASQQAMQDALDNTKKQLSQRDSAISRLSKEKEAAELEKLSESERAEAIKKKAMEDAEAIKAETAGLIRERDLTRVLFKNELDPELFSGRIKGQTVDEMEADALLLKGAIDKAVESGIEKEIASRLGGRVPSGGNPPGGDDLTARYNQAIKDKNMALAIKLKREMSEQK